MKLNPVLDVADLPTYAFGHRSILWWGTVGFCLIEATAFGLAFDGFAAQIEIGHESETRARRWETALLEERHS